MERARQHRLRARGEPWRFLSILTCFHTRAEASYKCADLAIAYASLLPTHTADRPLGGDQSKMVVDKADPWSCSIDRQPTIISQGLSKGEFELVGATAETMAAKYQGLELLHRDLLEIPRATSETGWLSWLPEHGGLRLLAVQIDHFLHQPL